MEWVLAAYLGIAHTASAPISISQPPSGTSITLSNVNFEGRSLAAPVYYGYRITYFPSRHAIVGVEAEMIHLKVYAETDAVVRVAGVHRNNSAVGTIRLTDVVQQFSISHGLNLMFANVVARRTLLRQRDAEPRVQVIVRLGAGPTLPHPESTVDGVSHDGYELGALAVQLSAGAEWRMYRRVAAATEYKFTRTRQSVSIAGGNARGLFTSHHLVFGVAWHSN